MKVVPIAFEGFREKGVLDFGSTVSDSFSPEQKKWNNSINNTPHIEHCYVGTEPTSVLDIRRNPSPPTSSSTLSSSHGGGSTDSSTGAAAEPAKKLSRENNPPPPAPSDLVPAVERCGMVGMEDWESVLSDSSPGQDQSILRLIMGDIEDPSVGLSKLLQSGNGTTPHHHHHQEGDVDFNGGFGVVVDQSSVLDPISSSNFTIDPPPPPNCSDFAFFNTNISRVGSSLNPPNPIFPNPPPPPPLLFPLDEKPQILNPHFLMNQSQPPFMQPNPPPFLVPFPYHDHHQLLPQPPPPAKRLNCGPVGPNFQVPKPPFLDSGGHELFLRRTPPPQAAAAKQSSGEELIGAYKSFSEVSPVLQFSNFTSNQALLEAVEGFDRIHIIDFDIGFGGQWSSFMQELALRNGEILKQYASEIRIPFELEILSLESLPSHPLRDRRDCEEAIAVNLPIASFSHFPSYLPLVLRFVKQLAPKIVVTVDKPCDRTDASFAQHLIYAIQAYSVLLESLDAVGVNLDIVQMIEKYLVQPAMEKIVLGRHNRLQERTPPWKNLLLSSGFSPLTLSNFTESQAECLVQRNPGRGFHVEKKQSSSSLVLCWQRKELISVSTWGC
ncbi:Scarecrow-like protein 6 [Senna tora]|uniref:Scarecrow-like protein 6 n=1 Tax=Senna tora TaxID=362788 RepID=A0A834XGE8_9FABA|nr:Scarecrow-like protein 6 [Senna tora]